MRHPTVDEQRRISKGVAPVSEIEAYAAHLAACPECDMQHFESAGFTQSAGALRAAFEEADPIAVHPVHEELIHYSAGDFRALDRDEIQSHLEVCDLCRDEVSGHKQWLEMSAAHRPPRNRMWIGAAIAASLGFAVTLALWNAKQPDPVSAPDPRSPVTVGTGDWQNEREWDALKADVRRTGVLPLPKDIREFAVDDVLRGSSQKQAYGSVSPSSTTVTETRPTLRWPSFRGSSSIVSVLSGRDVVARSPLLSASEWQVTTPLERGKVYRWQVLVQRGNSSFVLPAPPAPPALFRVLDAADLAIVERAQSQRPDDHLLLAIVYARAGLTENAGAELEAFGRKTGDPLVKTLRAQLPKD